MRQPSAAHSRQGKPHQLSQVCLAMMAGAAMTQAPVITSLPPAGHFCADLVGLNAGNASCTRNQPS